MTDGLIGSSCWSGFAKDSEIHLSWRAGEEELGNLLSMSALHIVTEVYFGVFSAGPVLSSQLMASTPLLCCWPGWVTDWLRGVGWGEAHWSS